MRLTKVTTRNGDKGYTSLSDGIKVPKTDKRINAMGAVDKLNSVIGWTILESESDLKHDLEKIQNDLFNLGGELSFKNCDLSLLGEDRLEGLETESEKINGTLHPLKEFILPGGTELASRIHISRAECRDTERAVVALHLSEPVSDLHLKYLNRLSDYLFILARKINISDGSSEILWKQTK